MRRPLRAGSKCPAALLTCVPFSVVVGSPVSTSVISILVIIVIIIIAPVSPSAPPPAPASIFVEPAQITASMPGPVILIVDAPIPCLGLGQAATDALASIPPDLLILA